MDHKDAAWETRIAHLWLSFDDYGADEFVAKIDDLVAELPPADAIGLFDWL